MEKISLIKIHNPFNRTDRDITTIEYNGESLLDIRNNHFPQDIDVVVSLNGKVIPKEELANTFLSPNDQLLFIPGIHGGGDDDKNILRAVLFIAVAIAAPFVAPHLASAIFGTSALWAVALTTVAINVIGGILINTLLPPPKPKLPDFETEVSTVYSWNPQTTQQQGSVVPKFYGTNKVYGNVISTYIDNVDDKQYLNVLIGLGLGPISRLYDYKLNDQPIGNLKSVEIHARYGKIDQPVITNFNDTKVEYPASVKLTYNSPYIYTTIGDDFDELEVNIAFPQGIWHMDDGDWKTHKIRIKIEIRKQGETEWRPITETLVYKQVEVGGYQRWSLGYWYSDPDTGYTGWVEIVEGGIDPNEHYDGEYGSWGIYTGTWKWIGLSTPISTVIQVLNRYDYAEISGSKPILIRKTFKTKQLQTKGRYEIRITKLTRDQTSTDYGDDTYFAGVREVYYDDFQYPRNVLVGIKALATDQLSGSLRFSCMMDGALIRVYNGSTWSVQFNNNPAWVCWDILTQPVFDNNLNVIRYDGIDPSRLDLMKFKEWADFCDELVPDGKGGLEKRITFNGGFDSETTMWEAALQVCQIGRAILVWNGSKITVAIDKPSNPVQLFTVGNIGIDSFKEIFLPMEDRAAEIEIDFVNREKDYERDKITVVNTAIDTKTNKVNLQLFGITKPSEAWRAGMYRLYNNQYITRTIEFETDIDSIACTIGDVINVQHDVPQWGYGGRIVSATTNTVTLDRKVPIDRTKQYAIMIRLSDDTVVERGIIELSQSGEYDVLTVSSPFTNVPQQYDVYTFGEVNKVVKPFRIISITRTQELKATILAVEYNPSIYNADTGQPVLPTYNYSALSTRVPSVKHLKATELLIQSANRLEAVIDVTFSIDSSYPTKYGEVWYRNTSNLTWQFGGISYGYHRIRDAQELTTYDIKVVAVNAMGQKEQFASAPMVSLYVFGKTAKPSDVSDFWCHASLGGLQLNWTPVSDVDLAYYKIRWTPNITSGSWSNAIDIAQKSGTSITIPAAKSGMYLIKAVDILGNESVNANAIITDVPTVIGWNVKETLIEHPKFLGSKTNMFVGGGSLILSTPNGIGYYVTSTIDVGSVQTLRCSYEVAFESYNVSALFDSNEMFDNDEMFDGGELFDSDEMFDNNEMFDEVIKYDVGVTVQIALSQDGVTWSNWQNFFVGDYTARAVKFRVMAYSRHPSHTLGISFLQFDVDMADRVVASQDLITVPTTGYRITVSPPFIKIKHVGISIADAQVGDSAFYNIVNNANIDIIVKNNGVPVERQCTYVITGY